MAVKSNIQCIIQGKTRVDKSHLIKLFAKILGKKLHVLELNKDNDLSILTKSCYFKNYNEFEIKEKIIPNKLDIQKNIRYEKDSSEEEDEEEDRNDN